jgi:hypothetical protein
MDLIIQIDQAKLSFAASRKMLAETHDSWAVIKDARLSAFSKCMGVLNSTSLGLIYIRRHLILSDWWSTFKASNGKPPSQAEAQEYVNGFDAFMKIGFIQSVFSAIESSFRAIVRATDPSACSGGNAEFKSVYSFLLGCLDLQKWISLLDLLRCIRNTIHNNGVYFHRSGKDELVIYGGTSYSFVVGAQVSFLYWEFLIELMADVEKMLLDVATNPGLDSIPYIEDVSIIV